MYPKFRADKTTQAAGLLIELAGGTTYVIRLIKLLYLLDKESLRLTGRPLTYDRYVSMDNGPVLSQTLRLINSQATDEEVFEWSQYISDRNGHEVELRRKPVPISLSEFEIDLVHQVHEKYKHLDRWELVELTHSFTEWKDPKGSSIPITLPEILSDIGKSAEETEAILEEIESLAFAQRVFG